MLREDETLDSAAVAEFDHGTTFEVRGVGEGRRLLVARGGVQGWISYKTRKNQPLVARQQTACHEASASQRLEQSMELGLLYDVNSEAKLYTEKSHDSPEVGILSPGVQVLLLETPCRAPSEAVQSIRVVVAGGKASGTQLGVEGWLLLHEHRGYEPLLRAAGSDLPDVVDATGMVQTCGVSWGPLLHSLWPGHREAL